MATNRASQAVARLSIAAWMIFTGGWIAAGCDPATGSFELTIHLVFPADQEPLIDVDLLEMDIEYEDGTRFAFYRQSVEAGSWQLERIPGVAEGETATLFFRGMIADPADPTNAIEVANGDTGPVALGSVSEVYVYFSQRGRLGVVDGPLSATRVQPQVVSLPDGEALVFGGRAGDEAGAGPAAGMERLTRAEDGTYTFVTVDEEYHRHGAAVVRVDAQGSSYDGQVLVAGGWEGVVAGTGIVAKVDRFDPATGTLSTVFDLPSALAGAEVTATGEGTWLLSGGVVSWGSDTEPSSRYVVLDALAGEATEVGSMEIARYDHAAVSLDDGSVLVCGGYHAGAVWDETTDHCEIWADGEVTTAGPMNVPRASFAMVRVQDDSRGRVVALGGVEQPEGDSPEVLDTAELYDPQTGAWGVLSGLMTEARHDFEVIALPAQRTVLCGGYDTAGAIAESCEAFDLPTEAFALLPDVVVHGGRSEYGTAVLDNGLILLVGGSGAEAETAYLYNP